MVVIRNDKYTLCRVVNGLVEYSGIGKSNHLYTEALKYVDTENDVVFIIDANKRTCEPTYGSLKRRPADRVAAAVHIISRQLNDETVTIPYLMERA